MNRTVRNWLIGLAAVAVVVLLYLLGIRPLTKANDFQYEVQTAQAEYGSKAAKDAYRVMSDNFLPNESELLWGRIQKLDDYAKTGGLPAPTDSYDAILNDVLVQALRWGEARVNQHPGRNAMSQKEVDERIREAVGYDKIKLVTELQRHLKRIDDVVKTGRHCDHCKEELLQAKSAIDELVGR